MMKKTMRGSEGAVRINFRHFIDRDLPEVMTIQAANFLYVWPPEKILQLRNRKNFHRKVMEVNKRIAGFMIYQSDNYQHHVSRLAVHPDWRRQGFGKLMVVKLIETLSMSYRTRISLEVRETNLVAQLFFKNLEFRVTKVLRGFYQDTGEDAYLMDYYLV